MKHLDFTIDFETCGLSANAAVMQVAVVPWWRNADENPFERFFGDPYYVGYVDLRTCVVDGFDFDANTIKWWTEQSKEAKTAVTDGFPEPIRDVLVGALNFIREKMSDHEVDSVCLWCQGEDVDIAILRNLCRKYDVDLEEMVPHTSFRDCRTVIREAALAIWLSYGDINDETARRLLSDPSMAYNSFGAMPNEYVHACVLHDALYDATRSSFYTWKALRELYNLRMAVKQNNE